MQGYFLMTISCLNRFLKLVKKLRKVWRMPLHKNYDKLMNSKNADVQNINYIGGAGSTTAVNFYKDSF